MTAPPSPSAGSTHMDYVTEILKWLPQGGAASAVIIVVILFLKQQDKMAALLMQVTDKFTTALDAYQAKNDSKLEVLAAKHQEQYVHMQEQVTALVKDQIIVNTKMTDAIDGLQRAVNELQHKKDT
jgi:fatty acid/phospholipid biosynthesis enzyme